VITRPSPTRHASQISDLSGLIGGQAYATVCALLDDAMGVPHLTRAQRVIPKGEIAYT
jgi:hypothetical protein